MSLSFPAINALGIITQRPYQSQGRFITTRVDLPNGVHSAYAERATALNYFLLAYQQIVAAEVAVLEAFFTTCEGRLQTFQLTDPDGVFRPTCRFDSDQLKISYNGPHAFSIQVPITEFAV